MVGYLSATHLAAQLHYEVERRGGRRVRKLVAEVSPPLRPLLHASSAMDQQALEAVLLEQIERLEQTTDSRHQSVGGSWEWINTVSERCFHDSCDAPNGAIA